MYCEDKAGGLPDVSDILEEHRPAFLEDLFLVEKIPPTKLEVLEDIGRLTYSMIYQDIVHHPTEKACITLERRTGRRTVEGWLTASVML